MNGDQEAKASGNSNRFHVDGSDEDYEDVEDVGSGVEDDAPESFQALNRAEPPWATFPDLLRVPTSTANNATTEDDSPESLSFSAAQPFRSNDLTNQSGYRSSTANPLNQLPSVSSTSNHVPFVGGIAKNRSTHPDVSHVDQSNSVCASSRQGPGTFADPSGASPANILTNPRPLPALPVNSSSYSPLSASSHQRPSINGRHQIGSSDNDYANRIANHPHRNPINSLNLSSALYSSSYSSSSSLSNLLAPIATALTRVQSSVDTLSLQVNERLDALENRLNNLTTFSASSATNDNCTVNSSDSDFNHNLLREMSPESLKSFIVEQKKEMHNERRAFLLSFADALREAADSSTRSSSKSEPSTSGLNKL